MNKIDKYSAWFINLLLSKTIILVVMIMFLSGIVQHINFIFDNWFISISLQFVILLTTINAKHLPSIKTKYGIDIPFIGLAVSIFMFWFIYNSLQGQKPADLYSIAWFLNVSEALFFAGIELIFAYLSTVRIYENHDEPEQKKPEEAKKIDGIDIDFV